MNYHSTDIHRSILRNIALNIELLFNDKDHDISEYDVQAFMSQFLRRTLSKTEFKVHRESFGKYDCAISDKEKNIPIILYEIKTFLKPNEKLGIITALNKIKKDLIKLHNSDYENVRLYFILVFKKQDLESIESKKFKLNEEFEWIKSHSNSSKKWFTVDGCRIRPSAKELILSTYVLSWEVKGK